MAENSEKLYREEKKDVVMRLRCVFLTGYRSWFHGDFCLHTSPAKPCRK